MFYSLAEENREFLVSENIPQVTCYLINLTISTADELLTSR